MNTAEWPRQIIREVAASRHVPAYLAEPGISEADLVARSREAVILEFAVDSARVSILEGAHAPWGDGDMLAGDVAELHRLLRGASSAELAIFDRAFRAAIEEEGSPVEIGTPDEARVLVAARLLVTRWSSRGQLERIPEAGTVAEELRHLPGRHGLVAAARALLPYRLSRVARDPEALLIAAGLCTGSIDSDRVAARRALAHAADRYLHPHSPEALLVAEDVKLEARKLIDCWDDDRADAIEAIHSCPQ